MERFQKDKKVMRRRKLICSFVGWPELALGYYRKWKSTDNSKGKRSSWLENPVNNRELTRQELKNSLEEQLEELDGN